MLFGSRRCLAAIEFTLIAFAIWNIPGEDVSVDLEPSSAYSAYSAYGPAYSSYATYSRRLAGSSYGSGTPFSTTDQLRHNVQSQNFAFSVFIALNNVLHIFKWCEVLSIEDVEPGAKTIGRFMVLTYTVIAAIFFFAAGVAFSSTDGELVDEENGSKACVNLWIAGCIVYFVLFMGW